MIVALVAGCLTARRAAEAPEASPSLTDGDTAFAARAEDPGALDRAEGHWLQAVAELPDDSRPLERLARLYWTRALVDASVAPEALETGMEFGWRCALSHPGFAAAAGGTGYRVGAEVAAAVDRQAVPCVVWLANNGLDRAALRGAGGDLDVAPLGLLITRARELDPDAGQGMLARAEGLWRVASGQPAAARSAFEDAIRVSPGFLLFRFDLAAAFPDAGFDPGIGGDGWSLENAAVLARGRSDTAAERIR